MIHIFKPLAAIILMIATTLPSFSQKKEDKEKYITLTGRVKDNTLKHDLRDAIVVAFDQNGNPTDTVCANQGVINKNGENIRLAYFGLPVLRKDSVYSFDIICPGYQTKTVVYNLRNIGKRESFRELGVYYLDRAPRQLGEVTVTASKIKFYHKGDTIVYNADAFQLSEGSMLDAIINQLPDVELKSDGRITVNGEYVESLLLNGKQFLDGNNQLMLDNIAAYTVKNIEIFKGNTREEQWLDDPTRPKILTMDVKLKREYNIGWLINAQGGYGTEDRYMGRLFASWFTPTTNITLVGNANNLNDNRKPGKNDTWTPEMLPSGTKQYKMAALNYNHDRAEDDGNINGSILVEETSEKSHKTTSRTNFLSGGNTFDNIFDDSNTRNLRIETRHQGFRIIKSCNIAALLDGKHTRTDDKYSTLSATFDREIAGVTREAIEAIYSGGSDAMLESVINRSVTRSDSRSKEWKAKFVPSIFVKFGSGDYMFARFLVDYRTKKEELWKDYNINFRKDPVPTERRRQFFDNSPDNNLKLSGEAEYIMKIGDGRLTLNYEYLFTNSDKGSYMYALDRLTDMGVFGTLPSGYIDTFDPANSYTTHTRENRHTLSPRFSWWHTAENHNTFTLSIAPKLRFIHRHMDYFRADKKHVVNTNSYVAALGSYGAHIEYNWDWNGNEQRGSHRNRIEFDYRLTPSMPELIHMVDIEDTSDPMNISLGNPHLKTSYEHMETIKWYYSHASIPLSNTLSLTATQTADALVRGYTYDTSTGIRRNKTYNVNGNNTLSGLNTLNLQFGRKKEFTMSSSTSGSITNYADMIGVDTETPEVSGVRTSLLSQNIRLGWQIGGQNIEIKGEAVSRVTTSTRADFSRISARHFNYGLIGHFRLPYGLGINTDFTCYTRRGYGSKELDTTDAILNVGLSFSPRKTRWTFMVDGFDLLHRLSNVHYAVNASGRTISYTNALPRYILFTAQYRLNIQPKKK